MHSCTQQELFQIQYGNVHIFNTCKYSAYILMYRSVSDCITKEKCWWTCMYNYHLGVKYPLLELPRMPSIYTPLCYWSNPSGRCRLSKCLCVCKCVYEMAGSSILIIGRKSQIHTKISQKCFQLNLLQTYNHGYYTTCWVYNFSFLIISSYTCIMSRMISRCPGMAMNQDIDSTKNRSRDRNRYKWRIGFPADIPWSTCRV